MTDEELTPEDIEALKKYFPTPEEKHNVHLFLNKIATSDDTTKTGYLSDEEIGEPKYPLRSAKEFALIAETIIGNDVIKNYFDSLAEITTATSLSKQGFLIKQATTTTKNIADVTKTLKKKNKGWFKKKDEKGGEEEDV